jgi:autotransporter translocation and assembly factor TamB
VLISGKIKAKIKGELVLKGREVAITIETSVKINRGKVKLFRKRLTIS